jgi:uncharacterized protein (DUF2235 family)
MKRLVFCFDGTWNRIESPTPTNVVLTAESVLPLAQDGTAQLIFYDEGVGTNKHEKFRGGMFGEGLVKNLADAYRFLIFNYSPGDEIFVFGFSRGAYTARSFVGLLNVCGVMLRSKASMVDFAIEQYKRRDSSDDYRDEMLTFRKDYSPYVVATDEEEAWRASITHAKGLPRLAVTYLGVWDTVGALGIPARYAWFSWINKKHQFHDTALSKFVKSARHAVAIDERRKDFKPTLWENIAEMNAGLNIDADELPYQERWFPGVHGSVGGGGERRGLSDQTLDWILDGARAVGLVLDSDQYSQVFNLKPDYREYIQNSDDPGFLYKMMNRISVADRTPGPKSLAELSKSGKRRWLETAKNLRDGVQYRPGTLARLQEDLDKLNPAEYGLGQEDDTTQKYEIYEVQRGDGLMKIAKDKYGNSNEYLKIYNANLNKLDNPNRIYPGQLLRIPRP